jgi:hypothetical protein
MHSHDAVSLKMQKKLFAPGFGALQNRSRDQLGAVVKPTLRGRGRHALPLEHVSKQLCNPVNGVTLRHGESQSSREKPAITPVVSYSAN